MGALNAFLTYDTVSLQWVYQDISHYRLRSICVGTRGTGQREKGGKVRDETWLFPRSGPKGQHKATRLYHLIQEITTQTFTSVRNQKHPCSDSWRRLHKSLRSSWTTLSCPAWPAPSEPQTSAPMSPPAEGLPGCSSHSSESLLIPSPIMARVHTLLFVFPQWTEMPSGQGLGPATFKAVPPALT